MYAEPIVQETAKPAKNNALSVEPFRLTFSKHGLEELTRDQTNTLQINVGLLCNQACRHCHLEAGPSRKEVMDAKTVDEVAAFARRGNFQVIDITGGAPELNPNLAAMIDRLSPLAPRIMLRSNLTALTDGKRDFLMDLCKEQRVVIVASLPSLNMNQLEAQRGNGTFEKSIAALQKLNSMGYARNGSELEIDLVSNPTGAFLPASQAQEEKRFRRDLERKWGIVFNRLYTFANVPLGRFRQWLQHSGNLEKYIQNLASRFNPCAVEGLMCRTLISVSWEGYLYDCDFNLARGLSMCGRKIHISEMSGPPKPGTPIAVSDHCYACTAGSGFT
jgi:radical SAM/Cys-rich protein